MEKTVTALDLIPWQQPPTLDTGVHVIEWNDGKLEIPRLGYLTANELAQIQAVDPKNALYRLTSDTAVSLGRASDTEPRNAFALLTMLHARDLGARIQLSLEEEKIYATHGPIISTFLKEALATSNSVIIRSCTIILQRIKNGWTDEGTIQLPSSLLGLIYSFEQEEEKGKEQQDPEAAMRELEDSLGKLAVESRSNATDPTGDSSTGIAPGSGQGEQNSVEKTSATSLVATSSKRSRKALRSKDSGFTTKSEP